MLPLRLEVCREYARRQGWKVAGEWVDDKPPDGTLDRRPEFTQLVTALSGAASEGRTVVCLINDWERFDGDDVVRAGMQDRVREAGGWTVTAGGETDRPERGGWRRRLRWP
jgi:hypothetical protein